MVLRTATLAFLATAGCASELTTPLDASLECDSNDECPSGFRCDLEAQVCFSTETGSNSPPQVLIEPVERQRGTVTVNLIVTDANADAVDLSVEWSDGAAFAPATVDVSRVEGSRAGAPTTFVWQAERDRGTDAYADAVTLRVTPSDARATGVVAEASFAVGNDPPVLSEFTVEGEQPLNGNVIISFVATDSSSDPVRVTDLRVSYDGSFADDETVALVGTGAQPDLIVSGAVQNLETSPMGVRHRFTWASLVSSIVDAPSSVLRMAIEDDRADRDEATSAPFYLRNQVPPRVAQLRAPSANLRRSTGPVTLVYRLIDDNGDPADVVFEYSLNDGASFLPCAELPVPESEGRVGLAAAPQREGGVEHVFIWDTAGTSLDPNASTLVRARAVGSSFSETVALVAPTGAPPGSVAARTAPVSSAPTGVYLLGKFDDDALTDFWLGVNTLEELRVGCAPAPCFGVSQTLSSGSGAVLAAAAGDLDGDGLDDIVMARESPLRLAARHSGMDFATLEPLASLVQPPAAVDVADVDGDGHDDIITVTAATLTVRYQNMPLVFSDAVDFEVPNELIDLLPVDLNDDGRTDFWGRQAADDEQLTALVATGDRAVPFTALVNELGLRTTLVSTGDMDDDDRPELIVTADRVRAVTFEADPSGELVERSVVPLGELSASDLSLADFNGDGRDDVVYGYSLGPTFDSDGALFVRENLGLDDDGGPRFGAAVEYDADPSPACFGRMDQDHDGYDEVIWCNGLSDDSYDALALASGPSLSQELFDVPEQQQTANPDLGVRASADFDGDGVRDLLLGGQLWFGEGVRGVATGGFFGPAPLTADSTGCSQVFAGDADGDGLGDLWCSGSNVLLRGRGDGSFEAPVSALRPEGFSNLDVFLNVYGTVQVGTADFDGDGVTDSIWTNDPTADDVTVLEVYRGSFSGRPPAIGTDPIFATFSAEGIPVGGRLFPTDGTVADLNTDGIPDLILRTEIDIESGERDRVPRLYFVYGQREGLARRSFIVAPFRASPPGGGLAVSTALSDVQGQRVTVENARLLFYEDRVLPAHALVDAGLVDPASRPLTAPVWVAGDLRLTAVAPDSSVPLRLEPRLGARVDPTSAVDFSRVGLDLSAGVNRGVVIDVPLQEGNDSAALASETPRVFLRVTDYERLLANGLVRVHHWVEIPRAPADDLSQGEGRRFALYDADGVRLLRVLTDRFGTLVSVLEP